MTLLEVTGIEGVNSVTVHSADGWVRRMCTIQGYENACESQEYFVLHIKPHFFPDRCSTDLGGQTPIVPRIIFVCWCLLWLVQFVESERHENCCSIGKREGPPADLVILVSCWGLVVFCEAFHIEAVGYGK